MLSFILSASHTEAKDSLRSTRMTDGFGNIQLARLLATVTMVS